MTDENSTKSTSHIELGHPLEDGEKTVVFRVKNCANPKTGTSGVMVTTDKLHANGNILMIWRETEFDALIAAFTRFLERENDKQPKLENLGEDSGNETKLLT